MTIEYEVWWVPQVPMKPFTVAVASIEEGRKVCHVLAAYDIFQLENRIKPDFCNAGGIRMRHQSVTDGEWWDVPDDEDELADILAECSKATAPAPL